VFLDVTDIVDYNAALGTASDTRALHFRLSKEKRDVGFSLDPTTVAGHVFPPGPQNAPDPALLRLRLASHLARHIRLELDKATGYTASVGVATSMLLGKLVGGLNKPAAETTLLPPYSSTDGLSSVDLLINDLDLRKLPGIGFRIDSALRQLVLGRPPQRSGWETDPGDRVVVRQLKAVPSIGIALLDEILARSGVPQLIGATIWNVIHGVDNLPVSLARDIPKTISIEDSFGGLSNMVSASAELVRLAASLLRRMRVDLFDKAKDRWIAIPRTLRLSTQQHRLADGGRHYANRVSRSAPFPRFAIDAQADVDALAMRAVKEVLLGLFAKLHPAEVEWDVSLVNVAVTNLQPAAGEDGSRDIGDMFRRDDENAEWLEDDSQSFDDSVSCPVCDTYMPAFAMVAHARFHDAGG
jgi:DNA polymerase iota